MVFGEVMCENWGLNPAEVFATQFIISRDKKMTISGFDQIEQGGYYISHGPKLPICQIKDNDQGVAFLGIAVDRNGKVIDSKRLQYLFKKYSNIYDLIDYLNYSAGRFAFLVTGKCGARLYGDPGNTLGFVYNKETGDVASSPYLALTDSIRRNHDYIYGVDAGLNIGPRFMFGYTADPRVFRPLANHYLNLQKLEEVRFWPVNEAEITCSDDPEEQNSKARAFGNRHRQVIEALAESSLQPFLFPLSAGRETRLYLASAHRVLDKIDYFYSHAFGWASTMDMRIGRMLADAVGVKHHEIYHDDPSVRCIDKDAIVKRSNAWKLAAGRLMRAHVPPQKMLDVAEATPPGGIVIRGYASDLLKAVLWDLGVNDFKSGREPPVERVLASMLLTGNDRKAGLEKYGVFRKNPCLQEKTKTWMDTLPFQEARLKAIDFMFMEQFQAHGHGEALYTYNRNFYLSPGNDRMCVALATSLPVDRRAMLDFHNQILEEFSPVLNTVMYQHDFFRLPPEQQRAIILQDKA